MMRHDCDFNVIWGKWAWIQRTFTGTSGDGTAECILETGISRILYKTFGRKKKHKTKHWVQCCCTEVVCAARPKRGRLYRIIGRRASGANTFEQMPSCRSLSSTGPPAGRCTNLACYLGCCSQQPDLEKHVMVHYIHHPMRGRPLFSVYMFTWLRRVYC